ncbi:hypothetical protein [Enterococcus hirae]|uniref:hypothetical protein n=1 Tax=Enterococcus hirae TaxID=1354 RepID=UPI00136E68F1|nr:hypothetical protein [Enterococcus hirae]NAD83326.1 hypothetical protein [Enterococcus hirae]NAD88257.1 hypothetical protein [Enterococcus hirae]NAD93575.1 hypothetical protein [Enterococcus hirae]
MSDIYFVKLLPDVYDELKTSKYKEITLENLNRTYLALERNRRNWYIPIKSFTEKIFTEFVYPLPVMEEKYKNNRRCTPGFVFNHSLYLDSSLVIVTKDPGMELYRPFIEENKEKIIEKFYYFVSVAHHINARVKWDSSIDLFPEGVEYILTLRFNEGIDDKSIQSLNKRGDREGIETYRKKQLSTFLEEDNFIKFLSVTAHLPWQQSKITQNLIAQKPEVQLALEAQEWKKLGKKLKLGPDALYRDHIEVRFDKETKSKLTASFLVQVFDVSELAEKQEIPRPAYYVGNQTVDSFLYQILFQSINQFKNMPIEIQSGMNDKQTLSNFMRSAIHKTRVTSTDHPDQLEYFKSEAIGYILAKHIGLHTESYSFEYLSTLKKSELSDSKIDAILVSISRKASQIYGRFRDNFNDILKKSMENDTVFQFQNNQSIELLDPVNKRRKGREASNERNQKRVDSIRLEEEKQKQHDPQVWIEVQTNSSERTNWNKDESKMQSPEEPNRENNSDYCREIESKQVMTVKEGDNRQSGDFKGKDKDDASLPLEKAEPSMNINGNDQQSDNLKKSSETNPLWFEIGVWEPVIHEKEKSKPATNDLNSFNPSTFKSLTAPKFKEGTSLYLEKAEPSMNINGNDRQSDNLKKSSETNPLWFEIGVWEPVTYEKEKSKPAINDLNQSKYSPTTDKNTHQQQTVDQKRNKAMNLVKQQEKKRTGSTEKLTR